MNKIPTHTLLTPPSLSALLTAAVMISFPIAQGQTQLTSPVEQQRAQLRLQRPQRLATAQQTINQQRPTLGLTANDTFEPAASLFLDDGTFIVRYNRKHKNLRVVGESVKVQVRPGGTEASIVRRYSVRADVPSTTPGVAESAVLQTVAGDLGTVVGQLDSRTELAILPAGSGRRDPKLVWVVTADAPLAQATVYYVDAQTGGIIEKHRAYTEDNNVQHGTGESFFSKKVPIITRLIDGQFKLQDTTRGGTFVYNVEDKKPTYNFHGSHYWNTDNSWGNGLDWEPGLSTVSAYGKTAAVDAMHVAGITWDMLKKVFGREGLNNDGEPMRLRVHYRKEADKLYSDANWDGYFANFGDGKEAESQHRAEPSTVAHELGHGVWSSMVTDDFKDNKDEAAGLNEGHGDIVATLMHHYRTLAGGQGYSIPTNKPRDLSLFRGRSANPLSYDKGGLMAYIPNMGDFEEHRQGCAYGHMFVILAMGAMSQAEYNAGAPCTSDSGNSYSCTYSAHLPQGMAGIGVQKAADIWYRATGKFPTKPTFSTVRADYLEAASELFGANSDEYKAVMNAFKAINVGAEAADTQNPTINLPAPIVDAAEESIRPDITASDDLGVIRLEISYHGQSKDVPWSSFTGYMSLANTAQGQRALNVTAFDASGKMAQESRAFVFQRPNFLVNNRGFESGANDWVISAASVGNNADRAFLGSRYISMTTNASVRQQFTAPAAASYCTVGYRVSVAPEIEPYFPLQVELLKADLTVDTVLNTIASDANTRDLKANNYKQYKHNVPNCAGKTMSIRFRTFLSRSDLYRIDNVFVTYTATPTANFTVNVDEAERTVIYELKNVQHIDPNTIAYVEFGSPGVAGSKHHDAPYLRIQSTADYVLNANYHVEARIYNHSGVKVYTSPVVDFIVREVNQRVVNPGFEPNGLWWNNTGSTSFCNPPAASESPLGFMGTGCARFFGSGSVYQTISLPNGPGQAELTFRLKVTDGNSGHELRIKAENTATGASATLGVIKGDTNTWSGPTTHKGYRKYTANLALYRSGCPGQSLGSNLCH